MMAAQLLFDHNLSPSLVSILLNTYPRSAHVYDLGLAESEDIQIWEYARANGFVIVSKDSDYLAISARLGHPPKVIRIGLGNCPTDDVVALLQTHHRRLLRFFQDEYEIERRVHRTPLTPPAHPLTNHDAPYGRLGGVRHAYPMHQTGSHR